MKSVILGMVGLGAGGAVYVGLDSPDYDRVLARPPQAVYSAFSALGPEGVTTLARADGVDRKVSTRISKTRGEAIRYEILLDDRPVVTADLTFAPAEEGRATRLTAELDIDAFELGAAYQTEAGIALSLVPGSFIDARFAAFMEDMAKDVEAGRPLPALRADRAGIRRSDHADASRPARMRAARQDQQEAVRPMMRPRPMVDPDRVARDQVRRN